MKAFKALLITMLLTVLFTSCFAAELPATKTIKSIRAKITVRGNGTITGNLQGEKVKIDVLSFSGTANQQVLSVEEMLSINGKNITPTIIIDDYGNRRAVFEIGETGFFTYTIQAVVETNFGQSTLQEYDLGQKIFEYPGYLKPTKNVESNDAKIRTIALNKFDSNSWLNTTKDITAWVHDYLTYDLSYYPETYSALQTLESKKGVCDEYSILAAAMLRAKEVPVRFSVGVVYDGEQWGYHAWMQAYNPQSGWIDIDPTFGEIGLVDGTHFSRGVFPDPADAVTKMEMPTTAEVLVKEEKAAVEIQSIREFTGLFDMMLQPVSFPAQQWFNLEATIKNNTNSTLITPIELGKIEKLQIEEREKILLFQPREEKKVSWKIKMDREVAKNQYLIGKYTIIAQDGEREAELKILPTGESAEEANIVLRDLLPTVENNSLIIKAELQNIGGKTGEVKFSVNGETMEEKIISISAFANATATIEIKNYKNTPYTVMLTGPGISYKAKINAQERIMIEEPQSPPTILEPPSGIERMDFSGLLTIDNALIATILIGLTTIILLLKELRKNSHLG